MGFFADLGCEKAFDMKNEQHIFFCKIYIHISFYKTLKVYMQYDL